MHKPFQDIEWKTVISVPEAAHYLGVGRKVIYQLIDFGELRTARQRGFLSKRTAWWPLEKAAS